MKKIILAVLMALMIATPCFAQEIEPEDFLQGTVWEFNEYIIWNWVFPKSGANSTCPVSPVLGFYEGRVYGKRSCGNFYEREDLSYRSIRGVSVIAKYDIGYVSIRLFLSNGKGIGYDYYLSLFGSALTIITLEKVEDNWAPMNDPNNPIPCTNPDTGSGACPYGMTCVDLPNDDCDPIIGDTDCSGICWFTD